MSSRVFKWNAPTGRYGFRFLLISCILLTSLSHVASFIFSPASLPHIYTTIVEQSTHARRCSSLNGRAIEYDESDYYFALNLTRSASSEEIRSAYKSLTRKFHPDRFSEELRFDPSTMPVSEIRSFLNERKVGIPAGIIERAELNELASEAHRKSSAVGSALQMRREEVTNRFALINTAYTTLSDTASRRNYNLSGDWGTPTSGKDTTKSVKFQNNGMGDRVGAKQFRERGEARQRDPLQQKVYERYMKEKAEKESCEAAIKKEGVARREREREERRRQRERLENMDEKDMTDEEKQLMRAAANQEKIKAMWGNIFNSALGKR